MAAEASAASTSALPATPAVPGANVPTILSTLHTLLRAHVASHPSPTLPYLHPFAPLPQVNGWKGKAGAAGGNGDQQVASLRSMREAIESSKNVLARGGGPSASVPPTPVASVASAGDKERIRVARAMREVITHESVLLPLGTVLAALPPAKRPVGPICAFPPAELLSALGKRLGLQVFIEDLQFGLLRTSLTLAGSRFVVDIDIEVDASGEQTEPPTAAGTPAASFSGLGALTSMTSDAPADPAQLAERGKVRLAKLSANHITPAGETAKSDWVEKVLRVALELHLENWNSKTKDRTALESSAAALESALAELKPLDELAEASRPEDPDLFSELESLAAGVQRICADGEGQGDDKWKIYVDPKSAMFPSFRLFDAPPHSLKNPAFRLRPASKGEDVPPPPTDEAKDGGNAMVVDSDNTPTAQPMCRSQWILEFVDDMPVPSAAGRGLIVRRTWLIAGDEEGEASAWSPSIKVEGLLNQAALEADGTPTVPLFPLSAEYVHSSSPTQHWKLSGPGPEGYVVGRLGLPASWTAFGKLVKALRDQLVLDVLFMTAFTPSAQAQESAQGDDDGDGVDVDVDMDGTLLDELDRAPTDMPVSATLHQRCMRVALALDQGAVMLEVSPSVAPPYVTVSATASSAVGAGNDDAAAAQLAAKVASSDAAAGGPDAVEIVRRVMGALL